MAEMLEAQSRLLVSVRHFEWGYSQPLYGKHIADIRLMSDAQFEVRWAGGVRVVCTVATDDEPAREVQREIARMTDVFMPEAAGDLVWLKAPIDDAPVLWSNPAGQVEAALLDWCSGGPNRFIYVGRQRDGETIMPVGLRVRRAASYVDEQRLRGPDQMPVENPMPLVINELS